MFDKLEDLIHHYEELMNLLSAPDVANDANRFKKLMKEQSDLQPIVDAYKEYKESKQTVEDSLSMLEEESSEEMREMLKEELSSAKSQKELLEEYLEKRAQVKKQQQEMLNEKIAKQELERSRLTKARSSKRQMAMASKAYDANVMTETATGSEV